MKKITYILLAVALIAAFVTGCSVEVDGAATTVPTENAIATEPTEIVAVHEHSYDADTIHPTCTTPGYTLYVCACGSNYIADHTDAAGHSYNAVTTTATCTSDGYTTYTCSICGDSYRGNYTNASGYSWSGWTTTVEPTTSSTGAKVRSCSVCGEEQTETLNKIELTTKELMKIGFDTGVYSDELKEPFWEVVDIIRGVYDSLPEGADDFDKICAAADWLYENCEYDYDAIGKHPWTTWAYSYFGAILDGKAVCAGYAEAFDLFMHMFEVESVYISGTADNGSGSGSQGHAWNRVLLEGNWYYVDTTWGQRYFMLSEEEISKDHFSEDTGYCTQFLPVKFLQRMYNVEDENILENHSEYREKMRQDILAGKTELAYMVRSDTYEPMYPLGALTEEERPLYNQTWDNYEHRRAMRSGYIVYTYVACHPEQTHS